MFCQKCGRELSDGEVCSCTAASEETAAPAQEETKQASGLPDGQAIADGAKAAAEAIKNNPMVSEVMDTIKGVVLSPVKQVSANAGRTDILWLILTIIESVLTSFGITTIVRRGIYALGTSGGDDIKYKDYSEGLKLIGLSAGKIFGMEFIWTAVSIIASMILVVVLMALCRKNGAFFPAANMTATVFLPSALLMGVSGLLSFIYVPIGIIVAAAAVISAIVLGYVGIQKLDKFTTSPFWLYVVCVMLVYIISALVERLCLGKLMEELVDNIKYFLL